MMKRLIVLLLIILACIMCTAHAERSIMVDGLELYPMAAELMQSDKNEHPLAADLFDKLYATASLFESCADKLESVNIRRSHASFTLEFSRECTENNCRFDCQRHGHEIYTIQCCIDDAVLLEYYTFDFHIFNDSDWNTIELIDHTCAYRLTNTRWYCTESTIKDTFYFSYTDENGNLNISLMTKGKDLLSGLFAPEYTYLDDELYTEYRGILEPTRVDRKDKYSEYYYILRPVDSANFRAYQFPLLYPNGTPNFYPDGYIVAEIGSRSYYYLPEKPSNYDYTNTNYAGRLMYVVNCDEWVSLRTEPDSQSERIKKVPLGEPVMCFDRVGDFYYCMYNYSLGYIQYSYLADASYGDDSYADDYYTEENYNSEYGEWDDNAGTTMYVVNCEEWVSLREEPDSQSKRIVKVPLGDPVICFDKVGNFYYCMYNDAMGYIIDSYLSDTYFENEEYVDDDYSDDYYYEDDYTDDYYSEPELSYTEWSNWQDNIDVSADAQVEIEARMVYGYYYFLCPACGNHVHVWDCGDPTWCEGCGYSESLMDYANVVYTDVYYDYTNPAATLLDWYSTGRYYYDDPQYGRLFAWIDQGNPAPDGKTQYRYRELL